LRAHRPRDSHRGARPPWHHEAVSIGARGRDEEVLRALRAASDRRWQARRRRRALIAKVGLCFVLPTLYMAGVAALTSRCKPPPRSVPPAPRPPPPPIAPLPTCPAVDGLEDEQRADAIARELRALRASSGRAPAAKAGCKSCKPPADDSTQSALNAIIDTYTRCHRAAPSSRGEVVVKAVVAPDGWVARTRVTAQPEATAAASCFAAAVATAQFARSNGFTVEVPFFTRPERAPWACPETVTAKRRRQLTEAIETVSRTCSGSRGLEVCPPRRFPRTFGAQLAIIKRDRAIAEWRWLGALVNGDAGAIFGLAWLRSRAALPVLKQAMLDEFVYASEPYFKAAPTSHREAWTMAIEHISGLPLPRAFKLTPAERRMFRKAAQVDKSDPCATPPERAIARWLLHELDGVPMRDPARDIPQGVDCHPGQTAAITR